MCTVVVVPAGVVVQVLCALSTNLISLVALCVCAGMCESEPTMGVAVGRLPPEHYVWPLADMTRNMLVLYYSYSKACRPRLT